MNIEITAMAEGRATIGIDGIPVGTLQMIPFGVRCKRAFYVTNGLIALAGRCWNDEGTARRDIIQYFNEGTIPEATYGPKRYDSNPPLCSTEEATGGTTGQRFASAACHSERKSSLVAKDELIAELLAVLSEIRVWAGLLDDHGVVWSGRNHAGWLTYIDAEIKKARGKL